jgi:hypothetical protein
VLCAAAELEAAERGARLIRIAFFWIQTAMAALSCILCLVTLARPAWIEAVFGIDPDQRSGSAEWLLVALLASAAVIFSLLARATWARTIATRA